jgi:hypothetical protein
MECGFMLPDLQYYQVIRKGERVEREMQRASAK